MTKHLTRVMLLAVALVFAGIAVQSARAADAAAGKAVFSRKCQMCHGADGKGNPGMAKVLHVTFIPLGSAEVQKLSDADLKKIITQGKGKMRPVQGLSDTDVDNVIAFIRTLKKK